jgi:hypothetical protein
MFGNLQILLDGQADFAATDPDKYVLLPQNKVSRRKVFGNLMDPFGPCFV